MHKCKIWNLYISPTCFCHNRNKTFILSWNKIHQLCHSEVVLLISCGLYPEDCIPLISSLQFLFIQIATWEGKRWGVRLGCLLALAEKGYSSWWELLWCFSRCLLGLKFYKTFFYAGWFSCTFGYVPVLLIFVCEHNCVSIIKQPQRRKYEWLWKKECSMWSVPIWEISVMWWKIIGVDPSATLAVVTLKVPAFWDSLK